MAKHTEGRFIVSPTSDGRFVAIATTAPFFCLRAESEEAALEKVKRAVTYCRSLTVKKPEVTVKPLSQTITSVVDGTTYGLEDVLEAA